MKDKKIIWIIGIIAVILILSQSKLKQASPGLEAEMILNTNEVSPSGEVIITYHPNTMNYMSIVLDVPTGWTSSKTVSPDGKIRTTADGADATITWTSPTQPGTYVFDGQYSVYPDTDWTIFESKVVVVCTSHADYMCNLGDVYWVDSCGNFEELREDCGTIGTSCGDFEPSFCDPLSNTINHERTCTSASCSVSICDISTYSEIIADVDAPNSNGGVCLWTCSGNSCDQNTPADTNYDGCVADSEFPTAVVNWKQQTGGVTDSLFPSIVAKWKTQENC